jgi:hypothetical protein
MGFRIVYSIYHPESLAPCAFVGVLCTSAFSLGTVGLFWYPIQGVAGRRAFGKCCVCKEESSSFRNVVFVYIVRSVLRQWKKSSYVLLLCYMYPSPGIKQQHHEADRVYGSKECVEAYLHRRVCFYDVVLNSVLGTTLYVFTFAHNW